MSLAAPRKASLKADAPEAELLELARPARRSRVDRPEPARPDTSSATLFLVSSSAPAISTSSRCPATSPGTRVFPKAVLNAFTTGVPSGTSVAVASALELSGG